MPRPARTKRYSSPRPPQAPAPRPCRAAVPPLPAAAAAQTLLLAFLLLFAALGPVGVRGDGVPLDGDPSIPVIRNRAAAEAICRVPAAAAGPGGAPRNTRLTAVQVPDPDDCNRFYVCCDGTPVHYGCRVPSSPMPYVIYSDAKADNSYYSQTTGTCIRTPGGLKTADQCPATRNGGEAPTPVSTDWADQVCSAVARAQGKKNPPTTAAGGRGKHNNNAKQQQQSVSQQQQQAVESSAGGTAASQQATALGALMESLMAALSPSNAARQQQQQQQQPRQQGAEFSPSRAARAGRVRGGTSGGPAQQSAPYDAASVSAFDDTTGSNNNNSSSNGNGSSSSSAESGVFLYPRVSPTRPLAPRLPTIAASVRAPEGGPDVNGEWLLLAGPNGVSSTGTVAMHAALIPGTSKVTFWARRLPEGVAYQPGMSPNGQGEVASVYDTDSGTYEVTPMRPAPFCTGQSHTADGTIVATGGDADAGGYLGDGLKSIRLWKKDGTAWEVAPVELKEPHWYPTNLFLGDGRRTLIIGGYRDGENGVPSPSIEIYDSTTNTVTTLYEVPVLRQLGGLNLYPVALQLPWTAPGLPEGARVIILFSGSAGEIMWVSPGPDDQAVNFLAPLPAWPTPGFSSAFSAAGGAALLPLDPAKGYTAELALFGGIGAAGACACDVPANDKAYRIKLDQATVTGSTMAWEVEQMPGPRVMLDAVNLPDGKVLLVNGAKFGASNGGGPGGGGQQRGQEGAAWLYNPQAPVGGRFAVLAASAIKRYYHAVALLLPSGDVLVAGSEQDDCFEACFQFNPALHQFQAELFRPPYAFSPTRPVITGVSAGEAQMGGEVTVTYTGTVTGAVLMSPAAVTHQNNMNQRSILLAVTANEGGQVTLALPPPGGYVAPPGYYMLFLLNGDIPCTKAAWLRLDL